MAKVIFEIIVEIIIYIVVDLIISGFRALFRGNKIEE
jgi:hypothetical protein